MLLYILHSIKIGTSAIGYDKVVIPDTPDGSFDVVVLRLNLCDLTESEEKIFLPCKTFSKWKDD